MASDLLSAEEAAQELGKSKRTITRKALRGEIPIAGKLPGKTGAYLFARDVIEVLASRGGV